MASKSRTLLATVAVISLCLQLVTLESCDLHFDQYRTKRINAIRGQILSKLGLQKPPEDDGPDTVPDEVMTLYNETVSLLREQERDQKDECSREEDEEEYYASEMIRCEMETEWPLTDDTYAIPKQDAGYSTFIQFDLSSLGDIDMSALTGAEIRLYQIPNTRTTTTSQRIELQQLLPPLPGSPVPEGRLLFSRTINPASGGWLSFDITTVLQQWVINPASNMGVELTVHCPGFKFDSQKETVVHHKVDRLQVIIAGTPKQDELSMTQGGDSEGNKGRERGRERGDIIVEESYEGKEPHLLVFYKSPPASALDYDNKRRRRSSLDASYCFNRPTEANCCLRELFVDFEKDLGWNWIHAPKGYTANYCGGNCPYLWSQDTQHTTVLSLYKSLNPDASASPCCVPKSLKSLTILYYENRRPKISQLTHMVLTSCKCS